MDNSMILFDATILKGKFACLIGAVKLGAISYYSDDIMLNSGNCQNIFSNMET